MPSFRYKVSLSDGRIVHLESSAEATAQEISDHIHLHLGERLTEANQPFGGGFSRFAFPTAGAITTGLAFGAPLTTAGAEIGTAIMPGVGTAIGAGLGAGANTFLGALAGARLRQRLQAGATQQQPPPFSEAVKEAAPFGTFGMAGEAVGVGAEAAAPFLKAAPRVVKMFLRPGTMAHTAMTSAAGGFAAGTTHGLTHGESLPTAVQEGLRQIPTAATLGAGIQAIPSFIRTRSGQSLKTAGKAVMEEADRQVQAYRTGRLPEYLSKRGHEIFDKIKQVVISDNTPISLGDFVKTVGAKYGEESPQVEALLQAFGRSKLQVTAGGRTEFLSPADIASSQPGQLAKIFQEEPIEPQRALDVATSLSSKIRGGAKAGFKRVYSASDSVNADARSVIYDVLRTRAGTVGAESINQALQEYGEFATLRHHAVSTLSPFGNVQTSTAPGINFLTRVASGQQSARTPDDIRLVQFLKEATGGDPAAGLGELLQTLQNAKSQAQAARIVSTWITRIGIAYPAIRAIFRRR